MNRSQRMIISLVFLSLLFTGVWSPLDAAPVTRVLTDQLSARIESFERSIAPPDPAGADAVPAEVSMTWPQLSSVTRDDPAVEKVNRAIQQRLLRIGAAEGKASASVDELVNGFARDYQEWMKKNPEQPGGWSLRFEALIRYVDGDLICLDMMDSIFAGEAHPSSTITYQVFSLRTGEALPLSAFIDSSRTAEFLQAAEVQFRKLHGMDGKKSLADAGFQFADNRFVLNGNFLVTREGIRFYYNPYEIAPYAMGGTDLLVPWADLKTIVKPDGPAKRFL